MKMVLEDSEVTFSDMDLYLLVCCEASGPAFATIACEPVIFPGMKQEKKKKYLGLFPPSYSKSTLSILSPFTIMVAWTSATD